MLWLAIAAAAAATPATRGHEPVVVQARAMVRIVSGVRLRLDSAGNPGAPAAHDGRIMADGVPRTARLVEFE